MNNVVSKNDCRVCQLDRRPLFLLRQARGLLSLSMILGGTWFIGVANTFIQSEKLTYVFTLLNSLQGLFIFIFHVVLSRSFRHLLRTFFNWFVAEEGATTANSPRASRDK